MQMFDQREMFNHVDFSDGIRLINHLFMFSIPYINHFLFLFRSFQIIREKKMKFSALFAFVTAGPQYDLSEGMIHCLV